MTLRAKEIALGEIALHQEWGDSGDRYQKICELSKYLWEKLQSIISKIKSQLFCQNDKTRKQ